MPVDWDALVLKPLEGVFAEDCIFTPRGSTLEYAVKGVFDEGHQEVVIGEDNVPMNVNVPALGTRVALFDGSGIPLPKQNDRFQIRGHGYVVKDAQIDSHGNLKLLLNSTE